MLYRTSLLAMVAVLVSAPSVSLAQNRDQMRSQAKAAATSLRTAGKPKDRCGIGAFVSGPALVTRAYGPTLLQPGDKLLSLGGNDLTGKTADDVINILRGTAPDAKLAAKVERSGKAMDLELACANTRPAMQATLSAFDAATAGKFEQCIELLAQRSDLGTYGAILRAQCTANTKKANQAAVAQLTRDAMRMLIEDATFDPSSRAEVTSRLRAVEGLITQQLGKGQFDELAALTRRWPGGETVFASSSPDWRLFKANAERALVNRLIDPESARIEWPYGFTLGTWKPLFGKRIEGYWTCGSINARNRMGGYTGATSFVVVLDPKGTVLFSDMGSGREYDILSAQCSKSVRMLPQAPVELTQAASSTAPASSGSIADELKKLVDLKAAGALTESEFQSAKQKLLAKEQQ